MSNSSGCETSEVRLRATFRGRVNAQPGGWPKRFSFKFFCQRQHPEIHQLNRTWTAFRRGGSVRRPAGEAFIAFLNEVWEAQITLAEALEPVRSQRRDDEGSWADWTSIMDVLTARFQDYDEMYVHKPGRDIPIIAETVVRHVGRFTAEPGQPVDDASCLQRGERLMQRSVADYGRWLRKMHRAEFRSVMFAVHHDGKAGQQALRKVAVSVMLPLTERAYTDFVAGKIADYDLCPADLQSPGKYCFPNALFPIPTTPALSVAEQSAAEIHCFMFQAAYFTRRLRPFRPAVVTFGSIPKYRERLMRHGYQENGKEMRGFRIPILLLCHPREREHKMTLRDYMLYNMLRTSLRIYQYANDVEWRREDQGD